MLRKLLLILCLLIAPQAWAGITDKYVNSAGSGDLTGSSAANAMSYTDFVDYMSTGGSFTATAGDRYNILVGTYARTTTTDTFSNSGSTTSPIIIRGYSSVITDGYQGRTNGNGALITTNHPAITYTTGRLVISGNDIVFESIDVSGSFNGAILAGGNLRHTYYGCVVTNSNNNGSAQTISPGGRTNVLNCDVSLTGSGGQAALAGASFRAIGCRIKGGAAPGVDPQSNSVIIGNVIYGGTYGIKTTSTSATVVIANNTIVGNTNDGINFVTGTSDLQTVFGNLITDNGGYGINGVSAANAISASFNRLDRNSLGPTNLATDSLTATSYGHNTTVATQANEYNAYASQDFRLLSGSPAKANGHFSFMDIGALQRVEPSGGAPKIVRTGPSLQP